MDRAQRRRIVQWVASLALVVAIFVGVLPQIADFAQVWAAITDMTWAEVLTLCVAAAWNIATYLFVMTAVLPGLTYTQAFVVGQSSTAVSTTLPAGSALGVGVTYAMYSSWGRSGPEIATAAVLSGVWNNFVKLGLPIVALGLLVLAGSSSPALLVGSLVGLGILLAGIAALALMLRSEAMARHIGHWAESVASAVRRAVRRGPVRGWADGFAGFRSSTVDILRERWLRLTVATVVSHLSLYVVLLLSLRHMGVSEADVSWIEVLGAFALVRLVTALPVTPGGLGIVELGLVAALVVAGGPEAGVVAAVLVFRFLTLLVQVPLGAGSYVWWQAHNRRVARQEVGA
jgi:putative heme transporter